MNKLTKIFPMTLLSLSMVTAQAEPVKYQDMYKQLDIMTNIIKSSVSQNGGSRNAQLSSIESTYLEGQGVVFSISARANSRQWGNFNFAFPEPAIAPLAPVVDVDEVFDERFTEEMAESIEHAARSYEQAIESLMHDREGLHKLKEKERELAYDLREIKREARDLEYQLKRADKEAKKELTKELEELSTKKGELAKLKEKLEKQATELAEKKKAKARKVSQERSEYYQHLSTTLAETFCLYGNGLKALPKDEKISVIIKGAGEQKGRRYTDQIFVFDKKDVLACASERIDVAKLMEKGAKYSF